MWKWIIGLYLLSLLTACGKVESLKKDPLSEDKSVMEVWYNTVVDSLLQDPNGAHVYFQVYHLEGFESLGEIAMPIKDANGVPANKLVPAGNYLCKSENEEQFQCENELGVLIFTLDVNATNPNHVILNY